MSKFVVLQIKSDGKILKKWFGVNVVAESTLADIYAQFSSGSLDGGLSIPLEFQTVVAKVQVGKTSSGSFVSVQPETNVVDLVSILGVYIEFYVKKLDDEIDHDHVSSTSKRDAFQLMMSHHSKNRTYLPELVEEMTERRR